MSQASILIADDQKLNQELMASHLGSDYVYHFAETGQEALRLARELLPDLLLLDAVMPDVDGFEVCKALRADPAVAEIPIVMITALGDVESKVRALSSGADDFLTKPFNEEEMRARVATITRLNRFRLLVYQRSRFDWVLESADEGFLILDLDGRVRFSNSRARELAGLPAGPVHFLDEVRRHLLCVPGEAWQQWERDPSQRSTEVLYLVQPEREDAPSRWLQVSTHSDLAAGEHIVRLRDVSETIAHQRSAWMLESVVDQKLRAPFLKLRDWQGLSPLLAGSENEKLKQAASMADAGVAELHEALEAILDSPRAPASGKAVAVLALPEILERMADELQLPRLTVLCETALTGRLGLSQEALERSLRELLDNSLRFHPHNRPAIRVRLHRVDSSLQLCVEDDGLSLTPLQLRRALLPYYQGEKAHTGQMAGMGLGLSTVASALWEVGGDIRLSNRQPGPGVCVELTIPVVDA